VTTPATEIGLALLIILLLVRDIIIPLFKGDVNKSISAHFDRASALSEATNKQLGIVAETLAENKQKISDLHEWHKPDFNGRQTWRDDSMIKATAENIGRLFSKMNDGFADILAAIHNRKP